MVWLWARFGQYYGGKAKRKLGDIGGDTFRVWQSSLKCFGAEQVKAGFKATILRDDTWPPELQEFIRLCVDNNPQASHAEFLRLPAHKATRESAAPHREKLRALLR